MPVMAADRLDHPDLRVTQAVLDHPDLRVLLVALGHPDLRVLLVALDHPALPAATALPGPREQVRLDHPDLPVMRATQDRQDLRAQAMVAAMILWIRRLSTTCCT